MPRTAKTTAPALTNFSVRLFAQGRGTCEFTGATLPTLEETLTVAATDAEAAAKRSKVYMSINPMGQLLRTYVDGVEVLANA